MVERSAPGAVFVDVDLKSRNIDLADAARRLTPRKGDHPDPLRRPACDMDALYAFAKQHKLLRVIEDAALAVGSSWRGKAIGSFGDIALFSFIRTRTSPPSKAAHWCNDVADAKRVEVLRFHGISRLPDQTRDVDFPAANSTCRTSTPPSAAPS